MKPSGGFLATRESEKYMTIYEYEHVGEPCSRGKIFEFRQSSQDPPLTRCPDCGGTVKKLDVRTPSSFPKSNGKTH